MKWAISYSDEAKKDIRDIYMYIAYELMAPDTAREQYKRITAAIRGLDEMPLRFTLYSEEPWRDLGMRWLPVDNFIVFYFPFEDSLKVEIARIMYRGRDIAKQLTERSEKDEDECELSLAKEAYKEYEADGNSRPAGDLWKELEL